MEGDDRHLGQSLTKGTLCLGLFARQRMISFVTRQRYWCICYMIPHLRLCMGVFNLWRYSWSSA